MLIAGALAVTFSIFGLEYRPKHRPSIQVSGIQHDILYIYFFLSEELEILVTSIMLAYYIVTPIYVS